MKSPTMILKFGARLGVILAVTVAGGCEGDAASTCPDGADGCRCTAAGGCGPGLTCLGSSLCGRPTAPPVPDNIPVAAVTPIVSGDMLVSGPRDLAFNPRREGELWVVNGGNNTVTIIAGVTDPATFRVELRQDRNHTHFMAQPSSLDFGADETNDAAPNPALQPGTFATCQESRNGGNDFMGPVLWSSDLSIFARRNGMLGSHLDMLHQSPLCMGIAWAGAGNVYWTFNGLNNSISKYDFQRDHGVGNDDHTDGLIWRYVLGQVKYVAKVPSHLFYRAEEQMLYIADTGNGRVVKLDEKSGTRAGPLLPKQDEAESWEMTGAVLTEVVARSSGILFQPSGLEIQGSNLYVSDSGTGVLHKFKLDGTRLGSLRTDAQPGGLAGMAFGPDRRLYFTDQVGNRVLRLDTTF
jgi:hypothetical protein